MSNQLVFKYHNWQCSERSYQQVILMSTKVIVFGDQGSLSTSLSSLRCQGDLSQDIRVQNLQAGLTNYLLFVVKDISLVVSQSAGTAGLLCFFSDKDVVQTRNQLAEILSKSKELSGIPLVLAINTFNTSSSVREVTSLLQPLKTKDRVTLIKQVDCSVKTSVETLLQWVSSQRSQVGFDAQPRVVRAKPKYREEPDGPNTYDTLMKDKKFKSMTSANQQTKYLALEKQRIKEINMQEQLLNFTKNKKKMTPYDIKPSPDPRIQPNLNFFLKDIRDDKPQQVSIKIQTDQFKPKPPSPKYVPKKTGVDCFTQIDDNELFDFDDQVEPILNVLVIRTLEEATLDIEEEEEMFKMAKYRELYDYKKKEEKNIHRDYLLAQQKAISEKEELLKKKKARQQSKLICFRKVQAYKISNEFTGRLFEDTISHLHSKGFVANQMESQIQTDYLEHLLECTSQKLRQIQTRDNEVQNCFDEDTVHPLLKEADDIKKARVVKVQQAVRRRLNLTQNYKAVNLVFNRPPLPSQFALNFMHHFDGTEEEHLKTHNERIKELEAKLALGEIQEDGIEKYKIEQIETLIKGQTGVILDESLTYGFSLSHNLYQLVEPKKRFLSLTVLGLNSEGDVCDDFTSTGQSDSEVFSYRNDLRDSSLKTNMDQGFQFELSRLKDRAVLIFMLKIQDLETLARPQFADSYKYGVCCLQSATHAVPVVSQQIKKLNILQNYKPDQEKNQQQKKALCCWFVPFIIDNNSRLKGKYLQTINYLSRPKTQEEMHTFKDQIVQYWKSCAMLEKEAQEHEQVVQVKEKVKSREGKRDRRKQSLKPKQQEIHKKSMVAEEVLPPLVGRMFPEHIVNLNQANLATVVQLFQTDINAYPQIVKSFPNGWNMCLKGRPLTQVSQLSEYKKIGDLTVKPNPEPFVQEEKNNQSIINADDQLQT